VHFYHPFYPLSSSRRHLSCDDFWTLEDKREELFSAVLFSTVVGLHNNKHTHMSSSCMCTRGPADLSLDVYFKFLCGFCAFSYLGPVCLFCDFGVLSLVCFELSVLVQVIVCKDSSPK